METASRNRGRFVFPWIPQNTCWSVLCSYRGMDPKKLKDRTENARFYGGFVEPRYRIHAGSNVVAPYVSARFAVLKIDFSGEDLSLSSTFLELNGGGGILVRLGPRVNLDVGATLGYNHLGEGILTSQVRHTAVPVDGSSGSNLVAHLGLAVGLRD